MRKLWSLFLLFSVLLKRRLVWATIKQSEDVKALFLEQEFSIVLFSLLEAGWGIN